MMYTPTRNNEYKFSLANGRRVYFNRISGYGVEHDGQYLVEPTKMELYEIEQILSDDDDAFADECKSDKAASVAQTELW